jgi:DnaA family protein
MKQLSLAIGPAPEASFDNFIVGANGDVLAQLRDARLPPVIYLWGPSGCGKTHLLQSAARARAGAPLRLLDDCDTLDAERQRAAFALFVDAATEGVPVLAAGRVPPVDLPLRDDLRSRLGWGPVYAVQPLTDAQARAALRDEAQRRGIVLGDEVIDFLLTRFARDLKHLMSLLDRIDGYALQQQRGKVTLPLLRRMFAEEGAA